MLPPLTRRSFWTALAAPIAAAAALVRKKPAPPARRGFLPQRIPMLTPEQFRKAYIEPVVAAMVDEWERKYCAHFPPYPVRPLKPARFS